MVTFVALPYQAYRISHSSLVVGLLSLAELVPLLVTAFVGGALADAFDRRAMLRWTEGGLAIVTVGLLLNSLTGHPALWVLFLGAALEAGLDGLQRPSLDALVPQLVAPGQLPATSALMSLRTEIGMIAAPALAGVLIAAGGLPVTYGIDAGTFLFSLGALALLGATPPPPEASELSLAAIRDGLSYAWSRRDLLGSYVVDVNAMFFGMPNALFPQFASHLGGAAALGVLYASPAVGAFLVSLTAGWASRVRRYGRLIAVGASVWGIGIVALGLAPALWLAALSLVVAGVGDMLSGLGRMTMWNESIPDRVRGRLAGIEMLSYSTGPTLGNVESGLVNGLLGLRTTIVSGGILCVAGTGIVSLLLPKFWRYDSHEGGRLRGAEASPALGVPPDPVVGSPYLGRAGDLPRSDGAG
jgi:MFS family permease